MNNKERQGKFTSSQAYRILGTPAVLRTYLEEKAIERRMKRCLDVGAYSQAMAWGKYMETRVFSLLGLSYNIISKTTLTHPTYGEFWSGSPDLVKFNNEGVAAVVAEVKCYYPKEFAKLTDALLTKDIDLIRKERPKEYWQVVSNSCIAGVNVAEIISYMPYESEMKDIKEDVENFEGDDLWQYRFIAEREIDVLPVLPDGGYYKNLNKFRFEIPENDIELLTKKMIEANSKLQ